MLKIPFQVMWLKANKNEKQECTTLQDFLTNELAPVSFLFLWKNTLKSALVEKGFIFGHSSRSRSILVGKSRKKLSEVTKHPQLWTETNKCMHVHFLTFLLPSLILSPLYLTGFSTYEVSSHTNWFKKRIQYRQVYRQNQLRQLLTDSCQVIPSV